jgi:hypothetical protein
MKLSEISMNVWCVLLVIIGAVLSVCHQDKVGNAVIMSSFALLQRPASKPEGS